MDVAYDDGARGQGGRIEAIHIEHIGAFWGGWRPLNTRN